jgi:Uma2 family endonuclease
MAYSYRQDTPTMTMDDFIAWMDTWGDTEKYELIDGYPVAMAGGSLDHDTIAMNLAFALRPGLQGTFCRLQRDVLVRAPGRDDFAAFPDLFIRCGEHEGTRNWVDDPAAVFEVLSPSTLAFDRGYKLGHYMGMPTLRHIALIYPREIRIEIWSRREGEDWPLEPRVLSRLEDVMDLAAFNVSARLSDIYEGTEMGSAG